MKHVDFPDNPKIRSLFNDLYWETEHLRTLIADWRKTSGWIMRAYRRDLVKQQIKRIRIIDSNLHLWGV